eukprot:g4116.t1
MPVAVNKDSSAKDSFSSCDDDDDDDYPCPIGERVYYDDLIPLSEQSSFAHFTAVLSLGIYTAWPYILSLFLLLSFIPLIFALNLIILSTLLLPCPLFSERFLNLKLFKLWRQYFSFSYYLEEKLPPTNKYLFAEFPHGTFPMGPILAATLIPKMFPGEKVYSLAADVLFKIPLYRQFMCWMGSQPATKRHFDRLISKASVAIVVGGIAEMFMQYETREQVLLNRRKGFVRMAVKHGVDIVPVFHFGNSRVMSIGPKSLIEICRKTRMGIGILIGRWGLPIPKPHPIYMVVGKRVKVGNAIDPEDPNFAKIVDELHGQFTEELTRLYNDHKEEFGWKDRPLEIV